MVAHNVFFDLKDASDEAADALTAGCERWLKPHDGIVFFACGRRAAAHRREVNDLAFDVGLHIVFADKAAHDAYQASEPHKQFIAAFRPNWARVRVFDSALADGART